MILKLRVLLFDSLEEVPCHADFEGCLYEIALHGIAVDWRSRVPAPHLIITGGIENNVIAY